MPPTQSIERNARLSARIAMAALTALVAFASLIALLSFRPAPVKALPAEPSQVATSSRVPADASYMAATSAARPTMKERPVERFQAVVDLMAASTKAQAVPEVVEQTSSSTPRLQVDPVNNLDGAPSDTTPKIVALLAVTDTTTTITSDDPDPSVAGQSVVVHYTVTPNDTTSETIDGNVTVTDGTDSCSASVAAGQCTLTPTTAGPKTLTATYDGNASFNGSSGATSHQVNRADTTTTILSDDPDPSTVGQPVTVTYSVAVVAPGSGTPTGIVTVSDGQGATCIGTVTAGECTLSPNSTGLKTLTAIYSGDANFNGSSDTASHEVSKAESFTKLEIPGTSVFGETIILTATVTSTLAITPTGAVFFNDNGVTIGTGSLNASGVATMTTFALAAGPHPLTAVYPGDENHKSSSSINTTGILTQTVERAVTAITIDRGFTIDANNPVFGQSLPFTVTVAVSETNFTAGAGTPTGNVIFNDIFTDTNGTTVTTTLGSGLLDGDGVASFSASDFEVGEHTIQVIYEGDANFKRSEARTTFDVRKAKTTIAVTDSTANPSRFGQSVTFTAVVSPTLPGQGEPRGKVFFQVDSTRVFTGVLGFSSPGEVRWSSTPGDSTELEVGPRSIKVFYSGDNHFLSSDNTASPFSQTVNKANTTVRVTSPLTTTTVGQEVTINAVVQAVQPGSGTPTGNVNFRVNTPTPSIHTLALPSGSTSVSFKTKDLPIGSPTVDVWYLGDSHFNQSPTEQVTQNVEKADSETTLESSLNPSVFGQTVTFTATVEPAGVGLFAPITPTGTVTFTFGTVVVVTRTLDSAGVATVVTSTLPVGSHEVKAEYAGDASFKPSENSLTQTVTSLGTTTVLASSASPANTSEVGDSVTFTATVTTTLGITPTGAVAFRDGGSVLATVTLNASGVATVTTSSLAAGTHSILAVYNGTSNFGSSSSDRIFHTVTAAASGTLLVQSASTSVFGQTVTFTATVSAASGTPTGDVTFKDGAATLGTATLDGTGQATFSTSGLAVGSHPSITAVYGGDANFAGSTSAPVSHTVNQANTVVTITSDVPDSSVVGQPVVVQYSVTAAPPGGGTPTGNVTVSDGFGATCIGTVAAGTCTLAPATTSVTQLTATYAGDSNFNGNSDTEPHTVNAANTTTSVTSSPNPSLLGQNVAINATVTANAPGSGTPTGNVTFKDGATSIAGCSPVSLSGGSATCNTSALTLGLHTLNVDYGGDGNFNTSSGSTSHTVGDKPTDLAVTKTDSPDPVNAGDDLTYIVTVANNGPEDATATLVDTLPAGVSFVSATPGAPTCTQAAGIVTCNLGTVAKNGGSTIVTIVVNVPLATPAGTVLVNSATVTGSRPDSDLSNNTATQETTVFRSPRVLGDCNGDEAVDRNDIFSIVRDIFDPLFPGTAGCDANEDAKVDAGDVPCTALIMGAGPGVCGAGQGMGAVTAWDMIFGLAGATAGPALSMPEEAPATGDRLTVPISFASNGHPITSLVFSVDYDERWLSFDPTDRDGNGIPDGVILNLPGAFEARVTFDGEDAGGELDIFVADITPPLSAVADGIVGFVTLNVDQSRATAERAVRFSVEPAASFGNTLGLSVPGTATPATGRQQLYLPLVVR
ncbi:MAG: Ig-like domain repeat protein [Anaerolineae bacterium]